MNPPEDKTEEEFAKELGEKHGQEIAEEHSWNNKRKENLKRLGLWEEVKND